MGRHSRIDEVEDPDPGRHDTLTSTGTHRAVGKAGRRRVAAWPIVAVVLAGLLVAGWFGWNWADGMVDNRAEAQAMSCQEGPASIVLAVAPGVEQPVRSAADRWNRARTVVHGHCVHVDVRAVPSEQALPMLLGRTDPQPLGGMPAAWVPESSTWVDRLSGQRPDLVGSSSRSVASGPHGDYPYLPLAGDEVDAVQQRAAQSFRAFLLRPEQQRDFSAAGFTTHPA